MDYSESKKKVDVFRKQIRKEQLDSFFAEQRGKIGQAKESELIQELKESIVKQKEFLNQCSLALTGEPTNQWLQVIESLQKVTLAFNGEFDYWFTFSIIKCLCDCIKQSTAQLRLGPSICSLFSDMICLSSQQQTHFAQKLMEYEILPSLIGIGCDKSYSLWDRLKVMMFCANLINYDSLLYRKQVINNGGGAMLILTGKEIVEWRVQEEQICEKYLATGTVFISIFHKSWNLTNMNVIFQMIPIAASFLLSPAAGPRVLCHSLKLVCQMLRHDRQNIYINIKNCTGLIRRIVDLFTSPEHEVRFYAIHTISFYTFSIILDIPEDLIDMDILDKLSEAWKMSTKSINAMFVQNLTYLLSNIATDNQKITNTIFQHSIFRVLMDLMNNSLQKTKKDAFFCLNTLVDRLSHNNFYSLVTDHKIIYSLILGLNESIDVDSEMTTEIISAIIKLVEKSSQVFKSQGNIVINELESQYRLTKILEGILHNSHNQIVLENADRLHRMIAGDLWGENFQI